MKSKRVLIPELKPKHKQNSKDPHLRHRRSSGKIAHLADRRRSEAVGLIMIGVSAFGLSLLHYLQNSQTIGFIQRLTVSIGMGVYIIPILLGLTGVQRFLDKPFTNYPSRLAGSFFALFFGLGLMGAEGGKLGASSFMLVSEKVGSIPTSILFFFGLLSSLVFALDILYKDVLKGTLIGFALLFRVGLFLYQLTLTLLGMLIGAGKTTVLYLVHAYHLLSRAVTSHAAGAAGPSETVLIPFQPCDRELIEGNSPSSEVPETVPAISEAIPAMEGPSPTPGIFQRIFSPQSPLDSSEALTRKPVTGSEKCPVEPTTSNPVMNSNSPFVSFRVETLQAASVTVFPGDYGQTPGFSPEKDQKQVLLSAPSVPEKPAAAPEQSSPLITEACETETTASDEENDVPFILEDNTIDQEIKRQTDVPNVKNKGRKEVQLPPLDLLAVPPAREANPENDLTERSSLLLKTLEDFGIKAQITEVVEGPAVSRFELKPAPGVKVARITTLTDDIALALAAPAIRIEAPIPGKSALGIEIPNPKPTPVFFYDLIKHDKFHSRETLLNLALGVTISGRPVFADLTEMPHLLIAGSTGSGKSVCVNTIIASILFQARSDQVKMVMIDPKMVELSSYNGIPHLISPVVTDPKEASSALLWAVEEMVRRYELLASCQVRKISTFNEEIARLRVEFDSDFEPIPYLVIIIDELADLMMTASAQVEGSICRLAQMARAVGIHLIIATQRPSVDVLTGIIKANLPSRIAFSVSSHIDSRTILDAKGAERLLGKGDMLFVPKGRSKPIRLQGAFVSDRELQNIVEWVRGQGEPEYLDIAPTSGDDHSSDDAEAEDEGSDSELFNKIEQYLATQEKTSTSMLQRKFKIGYNRAARIMDVLEEKGIVSPSDGSNKRRVIGKRSGT
jgi:ribosomal protein S25